MNVIKMRNEKRICGVKMRNERRIDGVKLETREI